VPETRWLEVEVGELQGDRGVAVVQEVFVAQDPATHTLIRIEEREEDDGREMKKGQEDFGAMDKADGQSAMHKGLEEVDYFSGCDESESETLTVERIEQFEQVSNCRLIHPPNNHSNH
jgi:hypothetical protein